MADPFGTAGIRTRVLQAWTASPTRFREDANTEDDYALGGHRDRLIVELAQNAADAAAAAGVPGRLLLHLDGDVLVAANTGAPLDAAGVEGLSTLRASAKRSTAGEDTDETVGRFGVGFAAVRAVSDEPRVLSRTGGVRWSRALTRVEVERVPALLPELEARGGRVPVLRLPWPDRAWHADGFDTSVVLPLRDEAAVSTVARLLDGVDAALLLSLPALAEVEIRRDGRSRRLRAEWGPDEVSVDGTRWRLTRAGGRLEPGLLADRPAEERSRLSWGLTWAVPVGTDDAPLPLPASVPAVVHAPTVTDEPCGLPALLLGSFPLDPSRRRVEPGPLADWLTDRAAEAYAGLVASLPSSEQLLDLVPPPLAATALDARLREGALKKLRSLPWLPALDGPAIRPVDACVVDGADEQLTRALAPVVGGLLPAGWARRRGPLAVLGVRRLALADVVDELATVRRTPQQWRQLYEALLAAPREELGALPVPLADGRVVRGPRGLLLPGADLPAGLDALGLRIVSAQAAHPLLERLGAIPVTARSLLTQPAVRAAVERAEDDALSDLVLRLVAGAEARPGDLAWLGDLLLADETGGLSAARELVLPGGIAERLFVADACVRPADAVLEQWGPEVLRAVGVLDRLPILRDSDVELDPDTFDHDLDGEQEWLDEVAGDGLPPSAAEVVAIADLDLIDGDRWGEALQHIAGDRDLRAAVVEPLRIVRADGSTAQVTPYAAWALRRLARVDGRGLPELRDPAGDPLLGGLWHDAPPLGLDPELLHALGLRTHLSAVLAEEDGPDELLARLAAPDLLVGRAQLHALYAAVAALDPARVRPPERVRVPAGAGSRVADADDVVVLDAPDLLPWIACPLPAPQAYAAELAGVLDLPLASESVDAPVVSRGEEQPVPGAVGLVLADVPATWQEHDAVRTGDREVDWRVLDGVVHAATMEGLARALAWRSGEWHRRWEVMAVLAGGDEAGSVESLLAERDLETPWPAGSPPPRTDGRS